MAAITLDRFIHITPQIAGDLRLAMREAVNKSALLVTQDARRRVRTVLGGDQRMSGVIYRQRNGRRSRVRAETIGKGGTRINPYYRNAYSTERPVALIAARGPAHYIEHPRKGGYQIKPLGLTAAADPAAGGALARFLGISPEEGARRARALARPALKIGGEFFGGAVGGAITSPPAPITTAFRAAPRTIEQAARTAIDQRVRRMPGF